VAARPGLVSHNHHSGEKVMFTPTKCLITTALAISIAGIPSVAYAGFAAACSASPDL
jgi:hypothetical protein